MRKSQRARGIGIAGPSLLLVLLLIPSLPAGADRSAERPTDTWIAIATNMGLLVTQGVDGRVVDADVVDGVVTLHGMVGSQAEKTRASAVARGVEGVERVRNVLTVVPEAERPGVALRDADLAERVAAWLADEATLGASPLGVHAVSNGVVILAGEAATPEHHRRAVEIAGEVEGVRAVVSEIRSGDVVADAEIWEETGPADEDVSRSGLGRALSDTWMALRLEFALMAEPGLSPTAVDVDVRDGIATLFGIVESREEREAAVARALGIDGVLAVENALQVVPGSVSETVEAVDDTLVENVARRLDAQELEDADISVAVRNATVRLTGSVATHRDRMTAVLAARHTRGVRGVSDGLTVRDGARG